MQNINRIASRLETFGKTDRSGNLAIQHQSVFVRTTALGDDDLVETNHSQWSDEELLLLTRRHSFNAMADKIGNCFEDNLSNSDEQMFPLRNFEEAYDSFRKDASFPLPALTAFHIEIRQAAVFSQNVYHFVKDNPNLSEIEHQVRLLLSDNNLPAETVNLSFSAFQAVTVTQLYNLLTLFSVLLRETAKDTGFIPGRVIGNFHVVHRLGEQ